MKDIISLMVILLMFITLRAQSKQELIRNIRQEFQKINADQGLKKIKLDADEFLDNAPDGGAELTGFKRKDTVVKIIEWIGLSYGNRIREFYFKNQQLIFVYEKFDAFVSNANTGDLDKSKTKTAFEGRYYFNKEKIIEEKLTGKKIIDDGEKNIASELLASSKENLKIISQRK